ncbi:MAG: RHS repeat protein [Planctomycetaceae bacterium]|nr:RHS repeat protein [Planctomycetaceae bacterium]
MSRWPLTRPATGSRVTRTAARSPPTPTIRPNRLTVAEDGSGLTTYTYDANGNQLTIEEPSSDVTTYAWDYENQMVEVEDPSNELTTYAYNADQLRVSREDRESGHHSAGNSAYGFLSMTAKRQALSVITLVA